MRDSSKRQADVDIEELEEDANYEGNETVTLGHDVEIGAGSKGGTRSVRCQRREVEELSSRNATEDHNQIKKKVRS